MCLLSTHMLLSAPEPPSTSRSVDGLCRVAQIVGSRFIQLYLHNTRKTASYVTLCRVRRLHRFSFEQFIETWGPVQTMGIKALIFSPKISEEVNVGLQRYS